MNSTKRLPHADIVPRHADEIVDEFPDHDLKSLAADLEADVDVEEGRDETLAIAAELRLRAAFSVRKWVRGRRGFDE
jgi:hypothetical protein